MKKNQLKYVKNVKSKPAKYVIPKATVQNVKTPNSYPHYAFLKIRENSSKKRRILQETQSQLNKIAMLNANNVQNPLLIAHNVLLEPIEQ